jgi:hypothetical protein
MTNAEFKEKVVEAKDAEWFKTISVQFNFPAVNFSQTFTGLTSIYEFVSLQTAGWTEYGNLPSQLSQSRDYFKNINDQLVSFVSSFAQQTSNALNNQFDNIRRNYINRNTQGVHIMLYDTPQAEFLMRVFLKHSTYFEGAYNVIANTTSYDSIRSNRDFLYGAILAYEFALKDETDITERRNAEKKSISKIRSDFQKYLSESEILLTEHLKNANDKYSEYVQKIDALKIEKEDLFNQWFDNTKNEQWQKWYDEKQKKLSDLETTYKEKLKLEEPAKYWKDRAASLKKQGILSFVGLIILTALIVWSLIAVLWKTPDGILDNWFNGNTVAAVKWTIVYATLVSFMVYAIRSVSKFMFSSFHLARDCEERHTLTYFYLSLLKDSNVSDSDRQLIMQSLFSRADTGLLKEDSSPTMPNDIITKGFMK